MKVSAQYAEQHFAELMTAADQDEEVEIARPEKPFLILLASTKAISAQPQPVRGERVLGALRGELQVPSDEEWQEMKKELEHLMNDSPLMSSGEI